MFSKKKCSSCGAKNPKERMTCSNCGAVFHLGQAEGALTSGEAEGEARQVPEATGRRRTAWFWVGIALFCISALWWLVLILVSSEDIGGAVLVGIVTTVVPIGIGVYCVMHGRKRQAEVAQRLPEGPAKLKEESQQPIDLTEVRGTLESGVKGEGESGEPGLQEKRSGGRAWFWVGVVLLTLSAFLWVVVILLDIGSGDKGGAILLGVIWTAIPIGIGIYCVRRGRRPLAVEGDAFKEVKGFKGRKVITRETATGSEIVVKMPWWFRVVAWLELILPPVGIWMLGMTTKVTFNEPPGYITVVRGHVPFFWWFLRAKRISKEEARSVFVGSELDYQLKVTMSSGKEVKLYDGGEWGDVAEYLCKRILDFVEETESETPEPELVSGSKFSMRVEEAFRATFVTGAQGMVVGGRVEQGAIGDGDWVEIRGRRHSKKVRIFEVDTLKKSGAPGERVRLLMEELTEDEARRGDIVEKV